MIIGLIKWFDNKKGFGVVVSPEEGEFFLHIKNFKQSVSDIETTDPISFLPDYNSKNGKKDARNCSYINDFEGWHCILNYLSRPNLVTVEVEERGTGMRGNPYRTKVNKNFNVMDVAARKLFKSLAPNDIKSYIIDYFDNHLDRVFFVEFCELLNRIIGISIEIENRESLLNEVFYYFGANIDDTILFKVWRNKKFRFIAYNDFTDYEIPEDVLRHFQNEIGTSELKRIAGYESGPAFCLDFVAARFKKLENFNLIELNELYSIIQVLDENDSEQYKTLINLICIKKVRESIVEHSNSLEPINDEKVLNQYRAIKELIPDKIRENQKKEIELIINELVTSKSTIDFLPELWLKNIVTEIPFELISKLFFECDAHSEKRVLILSKLEESEQFDLLKKVVSSGNWESAFKLIESLLKKGNSLGYGFNLSEHLFEAEYWNGKQSGDLVILFNQYASDNTSDEEKYDLFFKGFILEISENLVRINIDKLTNDECEMLFDCPNITPGLILEILINSISKTGKYEMAGLYRSAKRYLKDDLFGPFDQNVFEKIEPADYYLLWKSQTGKIFPRDHVEQILSSSFDLNQKEVDYWIMSGLLSKEEVANLLLSNLRQEITVTDRTIFIRISNWIQFLVNIDNSYIATIKGLNNDFYNVILWHLRKDDSFNFDLLKQKFIYFSPQSQVQIVRRLFSFLPSNEAVLTLEKLNELTRIDLDLYRVNLNFNPEIPLDISTDVILRSLISFKEKKKFLVESEILDAVLTDLGANKKRRFQFEHYFESCKGRLVPTWDWKQNGTIAKVGSLNGEGLFDIRFSPGEYYRDRYRPNTNFDFLKEEIKKIPGRKWDADNSRWLVPTNYETEVLAFGRKNRFFLDLGGSTYANNTHFAKFERAEIPSGITFCEGRLANREHEIFKEHFWWCAGQACHGKCQTIHTAEEWEKYTLLDFCEILELDTNEINRVGDSISKGLYYQFISLINRFNRLLEKIYCWECQEVLHPTETSHFAAHNVVRFACVNNNCRKHGEVIYLNHCLNGQCNTIIDSRISEKCPNGLFICNNCGSCCSHAMFDRRISNLKQTGGFVHEQLITAVDDKSGHLERAQYFCHKCKRSMVEIAPEIFRCSNCEVTYDTTKYQFKRPHRYLNRNDIGVDGQ